MAQKTKNRGDLVARAMDIAVLILTRKKVSLEELAEETDASVRTVRRYVNCVASRMNVRIEQGMVIWLDECTDISSLRKKIQ